MKLIIDNGVARRDMDFIFASGAKMLFFTLMAGICTIAASYISAKIVARISCSIFRDCYRKSVSLTPPEFDSFGASSLLTRTITDASQIRVLVINMMRTSLMAPVVVVCMLLLIFRINRTIFVILLCVFATTLFVLIHEGSKSRHSFEELQTWTDHISLLMKEKIEGVRTIRAFGNESYEEKKTAEATEKARLSAVMASRRISFLGPSSLIMMNWAIVIIYLAASSQLRAGMASISDLLLVFQYLGYFIACLGIIPFMMNLLPKASVACMRINELLDYECDEVIPAADKSGYRTPPSEIEFRNVCFGYPGAEDIVTDISFFAEAGKKTAFIGATGSGKTTVINLIMGFLTPTEGEILIDGKALCASEVRDYRAGISYAAQNTAVLNDTMLNNIRMYDEEIDDRRVIRAAYASCLDEIIDEKSDGMMSVLAEGGTNLSRGQRQRLSLARSLARDAGIYIFDDAFSALDAKTERLARKRIGDMLQGKTVIVVAQKISTIMDSDCIIMLSDGKIAGKGRHEDLLKNCREYRELYKTQNYLQEAR